MMKMSDIRKIGGNEYFTTYGIMDNENRIVGMYEWHWAVKRPYFVGWRLDRPNGRTGTTKSFETRQDAIQYAVGGIE